MYIIYQDTGSSFKQETPGVEESTVIIVEYNTVKEEIKEEKIETEDPLTVDTSQGRVELGNIE